VLVVCVVVAGSVVVSVVVVLVCANATGATNAQARAITVLFICTSLVYFDGFSRASRSATRQASLDYACPFFPWTVASRTYSNSARFRQSNTTT
jgi:hypothetical protein